MQLTRSYNTRLWVAGPLCSTMPQAGFDPPSAEVQTSTECEFDAFTLQATTAGFLTVGPNNFMKDEQTSNGNIAKNVQSFFNVWPS